LSCLFVSLCSEVYTSNLLRLNEDSRAWVGRLPYQPKWPSGGPSGRYAAVAPFANGGEGTSSAGRRKGAMSGDLDSRCSHGERPQPASSVPTPRRRPADAQSRAEGDFRAIPRPLGFSGQAFGSQADQAVLAQDLPLKHVTPRSTTDPGTHPRIFPWLRSSRPSGQPPGRLEPVSGKRWHSIPLGQVSPLSQRRKHAPPISLPMVLTRQSGIAVPEEGVGQWLGVPQEVKHVHALHSPSLWHSSELAPSACHV
jgi:hypothetical protein